MLLGAYHIPGHAQSVGGSGDVSPMVPEPPLPRWDAGPILTVGQQGSGTLEVTEGGQLASSIDDPGFVGTYLGRAAGSDGTVTVSGTDMSGVASSWQNAGFLSVGYYGTGTLAVTDGAQVTSQWARIGTNAGSVGAVAVSGTDVFGNASSWETGSVMIGRAGTGTLTIENGGRVAIGGDWSLLGWLSGSEGTLNVSGSDGAGHASTFEGPSTFRVGYEGTGSLNVTDGGRVTTGESKIGFNAGSSGTVLVSGADADGNASLWSTGALVVGSQGQGTLSVNGGGRVTSLSGALGEYAGRGEVVISGGDAWGNPSTWQITGTGGGQLLVGRRSAGTLMIENGGRLESTLTYIGAMNGGVGAVTVSGTGANGAASSWVNSSHLHVAYDPDILLMDEPFGALDSQTKAAMGQELLRIWAHHQRTVIFVTHDIEEAVTLSDRVVVLSPRPGRIRLDLSIDLPRPRSAAQLRKDARYIDYVDRIWSQIDAHS